MRVDDVYEIVGRCEAQCRCCVAATTEHERRMTELQRLDDRRRRQRLLVGARLVRLPSHRVGEVGVYDLHHRATARAQLGVRQRAWQLGARVGKRLVDVRRLRVDERLEHARRQVSTHDAVHDL